MLPSDDRADANREWRWIGRIALFGGLLWGLLGYLAAITWLVGVGSGASVAGAALVLLVPVDRRRRARW